MCVRRQRQNHHPSKPACSVQNLRGRYTTDKANEPILQAFEIDSSTKSTGTVHGQKFRNTTLRATRRRFNPFLFASTQQHGANN